jgi:DNA-binding winged helix-turn-helix (wHTH) protein/Tol biopolymer transport system component
VRTHSDSVYRFGQFEVNAASGELFKSGKHVKLQEQPFRLLVVLLENAGNVVSREDLRARIWPEDTFVDFDGSLRVAVRKLREALGDDAENPRYVETIPKRGYRFLAPETHPELVIGGIGELRAGPLSAEIAAREDGRIDAPDAPLVHRSNRSRRWMLTFGMSLRRLHISLIAISLVAVSAAVFWFLKPRSTTNQPRAEQRVTSNSPEAPIRSAVISPDGKYLAYSDPTGLYLRVIATGETRRWALPKDFIAIPNSWFPDGTHLLVARLEGPMQTPSLWKLSSLGGSPRKLMDEAGPGSVSPDGSRIAFLTVRNWGRELWVMSSDGSNPHKIAAATQTSQLGVIFPFVWSPNGQHIAYIEGHPGGSPTPAEDDRFTLRTCDANGGDLQVILDDNRLRHALAWAPDGRILFAYREDPTSDRGDEGVRSIQVDPHTGRATGKLQFLTNGSGSIAGMSVSSDGMRLVFSRDNTGAQSAIAEFEADTRKWKTPRRLTLEANDNAAEAWMPDSRTILFVSNRNGRWTLFKQAMDETTPEVLVEERCIAVPRLSADGSQVLYQLHTCPVNSSDPVSLMRLPIAGGPAQPVLREVGIVNHQCARLPATLCLLSKVQGNDHVYLSFDLERGIGRELLRTKGGPNNWTLSPDGRTLAVFPGDHRIRFFSVENGAAHEGNTVTLNDWWIQNGDWNADGKGILIPTITPTGTPAILEVNRAGKASVVLEGAAHTAFMWMIPSPDGRRAVLALQVPGDNNVWMVDKF